MNNREANPRKQDIPVFRNSFFGDDFGGEYASSIYESQAPAVSNIGSIRRG